MKKYFVKFFLVVSIFGMLLFITGCVSAEDENIKNITTVLDTQFTGPDQKLIDEIDKISDEVPTTVGVYSPTSPGLNAYFEEKYSSYFTEDGYDTFVAKYSMTYQLAAHNTDQQIEVKNVEVATEDKEKYDFTVNVSVYDASDNEVLNTDVTGRAYIYDGEKIASIDYLDDTALAKGLGIIE